MNGKPEKRGDSGSIKRQWTGREFWRLLLERVQAWPQDDVRVVRVEIQRQTSGVRRRCVGSFLQGADLQSDSMVVHRLIKDIQIALVDLYTGFDLETLLSWRDYTTLKILESSIYVRLESQGGEKYVFTGMVWVCIGQNLDKSSYICFCGKQACAIKKLCNKTNTTHCFLKSQSNFLSICSK